MLFWEKRQGRHAILDSDKKNCKESNMNLKKRKIA